MTITLKCELPIVLVSGVLDHADGSVSLVQAVDSLNSITVAALMLVLDVVGVGVFYSVLVSVFGMSLQRES